MAKLNPYSQHYRCLLSLLTNAVQFKVFTYLLDEHLYALRNEIPNPCLTGRDTEIAEKAGVHRGSVQTTLSELIRLKLLTAAGNGWYVNSNYLYAVVSLFNEKETRAEKKAVVAAFQKTDIDALVDLGLEEIFDGNNELSRLNGGDMLENQQICRKTDKRVEKPTYMSKNRQTCRNSSNYVEIPAYMSVFRHYQDTIKQVFHTKSACISTLLSVFRHTEMSDMVVEVADMVYDDEIPTSEEILAEKMSKFQHFFVSVFQHLCRKTDNINKEGENKKNEYNERSEALVYIEGGEEDFLSSDLENQEQPSEAYEKVNIELNDIPVQEDSHIKIRRQQEKLNKFSVDEVNEIIEDINNCVQSPAMIFINRFWSLLEEGFNEDSEDNEEDDEQELPVSIENQAMGISFVHTCIYQAYEETTQFLSEKRLTPDDDKLPIPDGLSFSEDDVKIIVGWKPYTSYKGGNYYTVTKDNFYNPQSPKQTEEPKQLSRSRRTNGSNQEEREDDYQYSQKIMLAGQDDEGYDSLTPIEKFIYKFLAEFIILDDDLRACDVRVPKLGPMGVDKIHGMLREEGLYKDDWTLIRFSDRKNSDGSERVSIRMFSAPLIRQFNEDHQYSSIIDQTSLEDLLAK